MVMMYKNGQKVNVINGSDVSLYRKAGWSTTAPTTATATPIASVSGSIGDFGGSSTTTTNNSTTTTATTATKDYAQILLEQQQQAAEDAKKQNWIAADVAAKNYLGNLGFNEGQLNEILSNFKSNFDRGITDGQTLLALTQETAAWKNRFIGNEVRKKNGLSVLSASEYIQLENSYDQVLNSYNIDKSFASREKFAEWIGKNISVSEINERAATVSGVVENLDKDFLTSLQKDYGLSKGNITTAFLDRANSVERIKQVVSISQLGAESIRAGIETGEAYRSQLVGAGITQGEFRTAVQNTAQNKAGLAKLATIDRTSLTTRNILDASLGVNADQLNRINKLISTETSRFSGTGSGNNSLISNLSGQI